MNGRNVIGAIMLALAACILTTAFLVRDAVATRAGTRGVENALLVLTSGSHLKLVQKSRAVVRVAERSTMVCARVFRLSTLAVGVECAR